MVDLSILQSVFDHMKGRVKYGLGDKAKLLGMDSHEITKIDCSGFVRFALYRATNGALKLPDGSFIQHDWVEAQGWHRLARYADVADPAVMKDDRLFIAFIAPSKVHPVGHVWLVLHGKTLESHGGVGVDSRPWNEDVLRTRVTSVFEVPLK